MSWEPISNVKPTPPSAEKVPAMGVSIAARRVGLKGGLKARYIKIGIGAQLAKALCMVGAQAGLRLSLGGGQVCRSCRAERGQRRRHLSRQKGQGWRLYGHNQRGQRGRPVRSRLSAVRSDRGTAARRTREAADGLLQSERADARRGGLSR